MVHSAKRWMTGCLAAGLMLTAACGGGAQNEEAAAGASGTVAEQETNEPIKLRILWWGSQSRHDATLKAIELYQQKHPNETFEPEFSGWDGYWDKLATQSAAKNAPDIIQMDASYLAEYAGRNQLADLSQGIDTSAIDPSLLATGEFEGTQYAIPLGNNAIGLAYNKEAVEKLGITVPNNGWTWDDYFAFGREAKAKLGPNQYALPDFSTSFAQYVNYQLSKGKGQVITAEGELNLDKATFLEWLQTFTQLRQEGVVPPGEVMVTDKELDPNMDLLANGTVLTRVLHAAQAGALDTLKPGVFDLVTMPRAEQAGGWLKPSMFWSVSSNSQYVEEAKKFIDWFVNDPEVAEILGTTRGVPVSSKIVEQLEPKFSEADQIGIRLIEHTAPDAQTYVPEPQGWSNFTQKDYRTVGEKVIFGQITPEQAYEELVSLSQDYQ